MLSVDVKGKGREISTPSGSAVNGRRASFGNAIEDAAAAANANNEEDGEGTDLVYSWMSTSSSMPTLTRSRSKGSVRSVSSRRSTSSGARVFGKRLFQSGKHASHGGHGAHSDEDGDPDRAPEEAGDGDEDDLDREAGMVARPTSPAAHRTPHVSFFHEGLGTHQAHLTASLGRNRSASRGSILSIASGSSGSTIRQPALNLKQQHQQQDDLRSEREERKLRQRRQEDSKHHLLRSRITLSLPAPESDSAVERPLAHQHPFKPPLSRSRTISLPLSPSASQPLSRGPPSSPAPTAPRQSRPFFVSPTHSKSMEPFFPIDPADLLVPPDIVGLFGREHRLLVGVWVEQAQPLPGSQSGSGKRSVEHKESDALGGWRLMLEWDVDLRSLISLGTDVSGRASRQNYHMRQPLTDAWTYSQPVLFPVTLPRNTLIFKLSNTSEYYTARLPPTLRRSSSDKFDEVDEEGLSDEQSDLDTGDGDTTRDGNVSDPGPDATASLGRSNSHGRATARDRRERERALARRRMVMERSTRETRMLKSVDDEQLLATVEKERVLSTASRETRTLRKTVDALLARDNLLKHQRSAAGQVHRVELYRQDLAALDADAEARENQRKRQALNLAARRDKLRQARQALDQEKAALQLAVRNHELDENVLGSVRVSLAQRRANLVSELSTIFPIEPVQTPSTHPGKQQIAAKPIGGDLLLFSICGIPLPNSSALSGPAAAPNDEDSISSALGYVAQVVNILAAYLGIPLYYPLRCIGSRSFVQDPISQIKGPKVFPLYSKGVDRYRFDYAVFLLNKDIEQLMLESGIIVLDLRQTLPNLKNLYLTLSTDANARCAFWVSLSVDSPRPSLTDS